MFGFRRFIDSINIIPKGSSTITNQGDLEVLNTTGKILYHNGTTASPLVTEAHTATLTNKSIDADTNTITNIDNNEIKAAAAIALTKLAATTASKALQSDASGFITASTVTSTELGYVSGVTSSIQTQLDAAVPAIPESTFIGADNQASPADVTGLAFSNASIRSFTADIQVVVLATTNLYEKFTIHGIQRDADWVINQESMADVSGVIFSITNAGQIQYISDSYPGFTSLTIKFRATTLGV